MAKNASMEEPTAEALLNMAKQYHLAATTLVSIHEKVASPRYFLFAHTVELALKAYLRVCGLATPKGQAGHAHKNLLKTCEQNGLKVGDQWLNIVALLESETKLQGFRYFTFTSTVLPEINYLNEVVEEMVAAVEAEVQKKPFAGPTGIVLRLTVGKPMPKV